MALAWASWGVSQNSQFLRLYSAEHNRKNWQMIDIINGAKTFATQGLLLSGSFSDQGRKSSSRDTQRLNTGGCKVAA